ncbi:MAG: methyltransferase [Acidobacteriota bacterium]
MPQTTEIARRKIAVAGLADRVTAQPIDFFADPLPKADVTMGLILHDWDLEKKMFLIRAAYDALPPEALSS